MYEHLTVRIAPVSFAISNCNPQSAVGTRVLSCEMRRLENACVLKIFTSHIQNDEMAPNEGRKPSSVTEVFFTCCSLQNETTGIDLSLTLLLHLFSNVFPTASEMRYNKSTTHSLRIDAIFKI